MIPYEDFARERGYNVSHLARLLKVSRYTIRHWQEKNIEVFIAQRNSGYVPFVSYEKLGKRK